MLVSVFFCQALVLKLRAMLKWKTGREFCPETGVSSNGSDPVQQPIFYNESNTWYDEKFWLRGPTSKRSTPIEDQKRCCYTTIKSLHVFSFCSDISMYDVREWCFQLLKKFTYPRQFLQSRHSWPSARKVIATWDIYNLFPSSFPSTAQFNPHHIQYICQQDWSRIATNPRIFMENYG